MKTIREVQIKLDPPSNWTVTLRREDSGVLTVGIAWGDGSLKQYTELSADAAAELLRELRLVP
jgi:hypothetical protein